MTSGGHPRHLAIIPDGNRRWSRKHGIELGRTYSIAAQIIDRLIDYSVDRGIEYVTVWPTSNRTWRRAKPEIELILTAVREYLNLARESYPARRYRFRFIGRMDRLRQQYPLLCKEIEDLQVATSDMRRATVTMAFDYNGREEIVRAIQRMRDSGQMDQELNVDSIRRFLDTKDMPDPDLLVRMGGDRRLSGFLPFQLEYTELFFRDELLPDFKIETMSEILEAFADRRYSQ